jgi:hypothetical protein
MSVVYVVENFQKWFMETHPLDLSDKQKLEIVRSHWDAYHMNANELGSVSGFFNNPNILFSGNLTKSGDRKFLSTSHLASNTIHPCGLLRKKQHLDNSFVDLIVRKFGGLYNVTWLEEFGMLPLSDDLFLCRTIQRTGSTVQDGVSPYVCLLFPSSIAEKLLHHPSDFNPSLFGGYRFRVQAKVTDIPREVSELDSDVKGALLVSSIISKKA